ncbi:MAG TPA: Maf family protein [Nitrospirota bacterium]|nr:Maf family protein [Nitrospirota bacterium]
MPNLLPIILASASPRRSELLRQVGISFTVAPADVDESIKPGEQAVKYAVRIAREKARMVAQRTASGIVIGADTVVVLGGEIMGKPLDARDAVRVLNKLSGNVHDVITGVAVVDAGTGRESVKSAITRVWFRKLSGAEIAAYVSTEEPLDKAGAYGIQGKGALFVDRIDGCYFNVVGLPLSLLGCMLRDFGYFFFS